MNQHNQYSLKLCFLADAQNIHTQKWVRFFVRKGYKVHIITFLPYEIKGAHVHPVERSVPVEISQSAKTYQKLGYLTYTNKIKKLIRQIKPDILHAHYASSYGLFGALSGFHPYIISTWGSDIFDFPRRTLFHKKLLRFSLNRADVVTATSKVLTSETRLYLDDAIPLHTIPFGIDEEIFKPLNIKKKNTCLTIGIVKNLEPVYGYETLMEAFASVSQVRPQVELLIVGRGSLENKLKAKSQELGLADKIQFTGYVDNSRVPEWLNRMDIFVLPSFLETFGVAAVEASACGLPVIASNICGLPEVVLHDKTGLLVPPGDSDALASAIIQLVDNEEMRMSMGRRGIEFVHRQYGWDVNAEKMDGIYRSVKN